MRTAVAAQAGLPVDGDPDADADAVRVGRRA